MTEFPENGGRRPEPADASEPTDPAGPAAARSAHGASDAHGAGYAYGSPRAPGEGGEGATGAARSGGRSVERLQQRLAEFARVRDWGQYHTPKNLAAALSVEAGELVEIFQWLTPEESLRVMGDADSAARVRDEVADVLAYLLQFCEVLGVDALDALEQKIERNEKRFPANGNGHSME